MRQDLGHCGFVPVVLLLLHQLSQIDLFLNMESLLPGRELCSFCTE